MSVRIAREKHPWRVEIDWPEGIRRRAGMPKIFRTPSWKLKHHLNELRQWLNEMIGEGNWVPDSAKFTDDHDLLSDYDQQFFAVRVKTEEEALLIKMRWS